MNTRRFPRTASEAFKDADYASALERPRPASWGLRLLCFAAFALIGVLLAWRG